MPVDAHGDSYEEDQYNGDTTYNGRVETNKMSKEEEGQDFVENVIVNQLLPTYFPEVKDFFEGFNSRSLEIGEYVIDTEDDQENGCVNLTVSVACNPDTYTRLMQLSYDKFEAPFKKACDAKHYGCQIMSNDDDKEAPQIVFEVSVY